LCSLDVCLYGAVRRHAARLPYEPENLRTGGCQSVRHAGARGVDPSVRQTTWHGSGHSAAWSAPAFPPARLRSKQPTPMRWAAEGCHRNRLITRQSRFAQVTIGIIRIPTTAWASNASHANTGSTCHNWSEVSIISSIAISDRHRCAVARTSMTAMPARIVDTRTDTRYTR